MEKIAALEDAIEKNSLVGIYSVFYTIAHGDPNFSTGKFRQLLNYVKSKGIENFIQDYDGEDFEPEDKWDEDYWALIASSLLDNFCEERIDHLEKIGKKVYPVSIFDNTSQVRGETFNQNISAGQSANGRLVPRQSPKKNQSFSLITEEQKRRVKENHKERTGSDKGNFLKKIFKR